MIFRIYYETAGGHVHMRFFSGKRDGALGKCGDLTMWIEEFDDFRALTQHSQIEFRRENTRTRATGIANIDMAIKGEGTP